MWSIKYKAQNYRTEIIESVAGTLLLKNCVFSDRNHKKRP